MNANPLINRFATRRSYIIGSDEPVVLRGLIADATYGSLGWTLLVLLDDGGQLVAWNLTDSAIVCVE